MKNYIFSDFALYLLFLSITDEKAYEGYVTFTSLREAVIEKFYLLAFNEDRDRLELLRKAVEGDAKVWAYLKSTYYQ